jgi:hypothetical protein
VGSSRFPGRVGWVLSSDMLYRAEAYAQSEFYDSLAAAHPVIHFPV